MRNQTEITALRKRVATNIKRLRTSRNWPQEKLGEHASLSQVYLSRIENARVACTVDTLAAIAAAMQIDPVELVSNPDISQYQTSHETN
ncbi:helix-turn-helix domain-containing protein [Salinisphaera aquimarina]|uniref:Helix-turn-helix domain-containing protein n=1 Tax=Salinisphaera aquimarina TaxID=2094031 RepID=A0ABV7ETU8_9GAMM